MANDQPKRVDPPSCCCTDCITGYSVPLGQASWETVKAMMAGDLQDATGTELDVSILVSPAGQRSWPDRQTWLWKYERGAAIPPEVRHFAETWAELLTSLPDNYECHMTCAEANAAADLYRALGDDDTAAAILGAHADHDEEGDQHYHGARSAGEG